MTKEEFVKIREAIGFTQAQMAAYLDVSIRQIANYENGKTPIKKLYAEKITSLLNDKLNHSHTYNNSISNTGSIKGGILNTGNINGDIKTPQPPKMRTTKEKAKNEYEKILIEYFRKLTLENQIKLLNTLITMADEENG
jgi:transcriptional regulator with XRE-family HTH domain